MSAYVLVQHKIGKWSEFERIFVADGVRRKALGCIGGEVFRNVDADDELFVLFKWDSVE